MKCIISPELKHAMKGEYAKKDWFKNYKKRREELRELVRVVKKLGKDGD